MLRRGRPVDKAFEPEHLLYMRITDEDVVEGIVIPARIRAFDQSVNWSKYSWPWDVVFDHGGCGVSTVAISELPPPLPKILPDNKSKYHTFIPEHVPEDQNYSHSEIRAWKAGTKLTKSSQIGEVAKKEYQNFMSAVLEIIIDPIAANIPSTPVTQDGSAPH
jgi:hypothetical protein